VVNNCSALQVTRSAVNRGYHYKSRRIFAKDKVFSTLPKLQVASLPTSFSSAFTTGFCCARTSIMPATSSAFFLCASSSAGFCSVSSPPNSHSSWRSRIRVAMSCVVLICRASQRLCSQHAMAKRRATHKTGRLLPDCQLLRRARRIVICSVHGTRWRAIHFHGFEDCAEVAIAASWVGITVSRRYGVA
jgi:hypothetical protein